MFAATLLLFTEVTEDGQADRRKSNLNSAAYDYT